MSQKAESKTNVQSSVELLELDWQPKPYLAVLLRNVFSEEECEALIARSEASGYEQALLNVGGRQQQLLTDVRNSDRCIIDDPGAAENFWQRILQAISRSSADDTTKVAIERALLQHLPGWHAVGLNERLRFLRYKPGNYFRPHSDGCYVRGYEAGPDRHSETSYVTCQIYLNESCGGGATRFRNDVDDIYGFGRRNIQEKFVDVIPKTGSVLLFQHDLLHEGALVTSGRKYVIRTDVMFSDKEGQEYSIKPILTTPSKPQRGRSDSYDSTQM